MSKSVEALSSSHVARPAYGISVGWLCIAMLALAGCGAPDPTATTLTYRNPTATLAGTTRFDAERFTGNWQARSCIGPCAATTNYRVSQTGAFVASAAGATQTYLVDGPGILRAAEDPEVLVVMWVDDGFRTAAIGTASGDMAAIISREATGGADRIAAAREILDFNGWDTAQLRDVK